MPNVTLSDGAQIFYQDDDFTDPWADKRPPVIFLHGFCRNSNFWYGWVPTLARHFRTIRWDARGVGQSSKPEAGYNWTVGGLGSDLAEFMDRLSIEKAFFVGESLGGMLLPYFTTGYSDRVLGFVACAAPSAIKGQAGRDLAVGAADMATAIRTTPTIEDYIRATEDGRLAPSETPEGMRDWYRDEWATTPRRTWEEWSSVLVPTVDITTEMLGKIEVPVLFISPSRSPRLPIANGQSWTDALPKGEHVLVDAESQGIAMAKADECAALARDFFLRISDPL